MATASGSSSIPTASGAHAGRGASVDTEAAVGIDHAVAGPGVQLRQRQSVEGMRPLPAHLEKRPGAHGHALAEPVFLRGLLAGQEAGRFPARTPGPDGPEPRNVGHERLGVAPSPTALHQEDAGPVHQAPEREAKFGPCRKARGVAPPPLPEVLPESGEGRFQEEARAFGSHVHQSIGTLQRVEASDHLGRRARPRPGSRADVPRRPPARPDPQPPQGEGGPVPVAELRGGP
jgi:hypothetical protein